MQYFDEIARGFKAGRGSAKEFDAFMFDLFEAQDDLAENGGSHDVYKIVQQTWKLMADLPDYHPACAKVLVGLIEGLAAGCGRNIAVGIKPGAGGAPPFVWSLS
jgi:hypothetical protein